MTGYGLVPEVLSAKTMPAMIFNNAPQTLLKPDMGELKSTK